MKSFTKKYPKTARAIRYGGNALTIAHQAYNMARVVASIVNSEKKYHDVSFTINPDVTTQLQSLTQIPQGNTDITRNGDSVAIKSLTFKCQYFSDPAVTAEAVRIMLIRDYDNANGTAPTGAQILESATNIISFRNKDFPKRFKVLMDKVITTNTNIKTRFIDKYKKFNMMKDKKGNPTVSQKVTFTGLNATDIARGHLYIVVLGNTATGATASQLNFNSRIRFYDN